VSFKKERHEPSSDNDSLFVHDGSALRDPRQAPMDIDDPNDQPLKRTVLPRTPRSPSESQVSHQSAKPNKANKTKRRSNKKGVTTSRKAQARDKASESKPKSTSKERGLLGDPSASGHNLGSKFTFATLTHGPYQTKEVVQVRVSQRILEKKTVKQTQQQDNNSNDSSFELRPSRRKSLRKSTSSSKPQEASKGKGNNGSKGRDNVSKGDNASKRRSTKLLNFEDDNDLLSIDYLKDHCQEIKLCLDLSEDSALTDRDRQLAKYIREFASLKQQAEQMTEPQRH
jgi:hypothetical protein